MADNMITAEIWLMVNEDGEYVATHDENYLGEQYDDCIGGTPKNVRTIKLNLSVPLPTSVEVSGEIEADQTDGEIALTVEA